MRIFLMSFAFLTSLSIVAVSCGDDSTAYDCTGLTPTYSGNVKAIFDTNCASAGCHGNGSAEAGVDLSTYSGAKSASLDGEVLCSIEHGNGCEAMPQGGTQLDDATIKIVACWIENGAPN